MWKISNINVIDYYNIILIKKEKKISFDVQMSHRLPNLYFSSEHHETLAIYFRIVLLSKNKI